MISDLVAPALAALSLLLLSSAIGIPMIRKLILMHEARHELRMGSAGFLRTMAGWLAIVVWLLLTWFVSTVLGDWGATGDLDGAIARSQVRLWIIIEILAALADS
ncbi:MAG: hypothetical protein AAFN94_05500 [Pseudomonadota bacterium]